MKAALLVAASCLALTGCVALQKDALIRSKVADYAYQMPIEDVWPGVTALLKDEGYQFNEDPASYVLTTDWKEEMGGSKVSGVWTRYMVQGARLDDARSKVRFMRESKTSYDDKEKLRTQGNDFRKEQEDPDQKQPGYTVAQLAYMSQNNTGSLKRGASDNTQQGLTRDLHMEWMLIQRLAPEHAHQIEASAGQP